MDGNILRIGSRDSLLAVAQSRLVAEALQAAHPALVIEFVTMKTTGDRILDRPLSRVGGKGLFVKELDAALLEGRIDCAVHSLKDLPMEENPALPLVAFTKRADPRDVLILPPGCAAPETALPIGCSSLRRQLLIAPLFPAHHFASVRGNVQTRMRKMEEGGYGALVLAAAGLARLGLSERVSCYFSTDEVIPAAGQGILAVQARSDVPADLFACVDDAEARICGMTERAFVRALNGGCSAPVAAFAELRGELLTLSGFYADEESGLQACGMREGAAEMAQSFAVELAQELRECCQKSWEETAE